jgi:hypothetical protein
MRRLLDRTIEKLYILPEDIALARISDRMEVIGHLLADDLKLAQSHSIVEDRPCAD